MKKFSFIALAALFLAGSLAKADTQMTFRTTQVGKQIVAVSSDFRFYGIVCKPGIPFFTKSRADLLAPNPEGDLTTETYAKTGYNKWGSDGPQSKSWPLDAAAVNQICNHPNGEYTLNLSTTNGATVVEFVGGHSMVAEAPNASRGF